MLFSRFAFLVFVLVISQGGLARAQGSACVLYVQNDGSPVSVQASCDGADLKEIFQSTGISAGISKGIPHFLEKGYAFSGCTESRSEGNNGSAYARCYFLRK